MRVKTFAVIYTSQQLSDFFFSWYDEHRDLHVLTHSFPTRRSSDLKPGFCCCACGRVVVVHCSGASLLKVREMKLGKLERAQTQCRSEEHTSELQSLLRMSYAVFCLKKKNTDFKSAYRHTDPISLQSSSYTIYIVITTLYPVL